MNCKTCKFCVLEDARILLAGECYRYPPIVNTNNVSVRPRIELPDKEFCGEFIQGNSEVIKYER